MQDLKEDTENLINLLKNSSEWDPEHDLKLKELEELLINQKNIKKAIIFSQSKETAKYLYCELSRRGLKRIGLATGGMDNIQQTIKSFSPRSNNTSINPKDEVSFLIATDVLSEGQNLQDCNTVINYDLPWAIIKLIQRVGRVDRIGQESDEILCYCFMPSEGVEELIRLKSRIQHRLRENAEVIGTDEQFFQDEEQVLLDLYSEKSEIVDREILEDMDLPSYALEIWNKAIKSDPELEKKIIDMPNSVHSTKSSNDESNRVLLFAKSHVTNNLLELDENENIVTENQKEILEKAACDPDASSQKKMKNHYKIIGSGLGKIEEGLEKINMVGRLGRKSPRKKSYDLFDGILNKSEGDELIIDDIYTYPLLSDTENTLSRMFRRAVPAQTMMEHIRERFRNETLVNKKEAQRMSEKPQIVCSMGLVKE